MGTTSDTPPASGFGVNLTDRIVTRDAEIAVIGQGYVGLTLAANAAEAGFVVTGIDIDEDRVARLSRGEHAVPGVDEGLFREAFESGLLKFTTDLSAIGRARGVFICVPTPVRDQTPDLSFIKAAATDVAKHLSPGTLVVLESTTYPGTTDELVRATLESAGFSLGSDFLLAYSPERIDPGNPEFGMRNTPRIVGGADRESTEAAVAFYQQMVDKVVAVSDMRTAETAKLMENTFRHVNIALVNELAMLCHEIDMDVWEVLEAAATKPFGFMPFSPGPGIGGHCIPLDPTYLAWQFRRQSGRRFGVLDQAQDVNERMPNWIASRVSDLLNQEGLAVRGAKILVLGVTYKPDVGDVRESPALRTMQALYKKGADVSFHDFFVEEAPLNGGSIRCADLETAVPAADLVVLLTPHSGYDLDAIAERARMVFDTRNAYGAARRPNVIPL